MIWCLNILLFHFAQGNCNRVYRLMGKQTVSVDSCDRGSDNDNADVEYEEVSEEEDPSEEEPSEEEPIEEDPGEDELQEVNSCEEPDKDSCQGNEENLCGQQLDEVASCEVDPNEEDSFEEEPNEDVSLEEETNEVNSFGTPSEDACAGEQSDESCEEEPYEDDEQCEKERIDEDSCEEVPDIEEPCGEPEEPCEEEPEEEEPIEDPEDEPSEGSPVNSSYNRNNENSAQPNLGNMNMPSGAKRISELSGMRNSSNNVIVQEKQAITEGTEKKRCSKWDIKDEANKLAENGDGMARKMRKTRWSDDNSQFSMGTTLKSPGVEIDLEIPKLHAQLLEIGKKLRSGVVDDRPLSERSPSPPPIYNSLGLKINTREARLRSKLMKQRQTIISELIRRSPNFKPPPDYKSFKLQKKLYIPSKEYPGYNFVGLILGPCGNTQKRMEKETGAKILLRGKGSAPGGKLMQNKPDPSDKEDLHVLIEADDRYSLDAAVAMVEKLLIPVEDGQNIHKLSQLRELAELKGTLRGTTSNSRSSGPCDTCGDASHPTLVCPLTASTSGVNSIGRQVNFFAEMGGGHSSVPLLPLPTMLPSANSVVQVSKSTEEIDDANLFVCQLPQTMDDNKLIELFSPFGPLCEAKVIRDRKTGLSKGYGFVKYTDGRNAATAMAQMNGYSIDQKMLSVQIAGVPPVQSNGGSGGLLGLLPIYPGPAATARKHWPGPPESRLPETVSFFSSSGSSLSNNSNLPIHDTPFSGLYSMSHGPSCQTPYPMPPFSGDLAISSELAQFPGYLKSLDSPAESYYQSTPSIGLSSSQAPFTQNFGSFQMPPT